MQNKADRFWVFYDTIGIKYLINRHKIAAIEYKDEFQYMMHIPNFQNNNTSDRPNNFSVSTYSDSKNPSFDDVIEWINYKELDDNG